MENNIFSFTADTAGERIDALLARNLADLSRSAAQRLIEEGNVLVNGAAVKKNYKSALGDEVSVRSVLMRRNQAETIFSSKAVR